MNNYCVYRHRRLDTNEIFYVGISGNMKRPYHSKTNRNRFWNNIVNKTEYKVEIVATNLYKEDAKELEIFMIKLYGRSNIKQGPLSNLTDGGESANGHKHTIEAKLKIANAVKKRMSDPEYLQKMICHNTGSKRSEETKLKMRNSQLGKKASLETKKKQSQFNKEKIYNNQSHIKPIRIIDKITLNIYNSITEASLELKINKSTLTHYLLGSRKNKTNLIYLKDYET